jgi:chromosome segregation ATPase
MLPDVSSTSTVHKYFATWKNEMDANSQSLYDKLGFSAEFTQGFMKEITRFGVQAEQRYKEQAIDANEQRDQALEDLERSEERTHKQFAVVEQQSKEIKELQTELITVKKNLEGELAKDKRAHEATVNELRQQLSKNADTSTSLLQQNETLRTEMAKAELKLEGNQEFVNEVKAQNTEYQIENKTLNKSVSDLNAILASQTATIKGNDKLVAQLETTANKLEGANKTIEKENIKLTVEKTSLSQQANDFALKLSETTNIISELKSTMTEQSKVISTLTEKQSKKQ